MNNNEATPVREHFLFVTGQLAEHAVRSVVSDLANKLNFDYSIAVLPITVAALMTPKWLLRKLQVPENVTRVVVPGYLQSGLQELRDALQLPVDCGPRDIRNLSEFFGKKREIAAELTSYSIEILAEINHAPSLTIEQLIARATLLREQGADVIDLGCTPGVQWSTIGESVRALRELGMRVSIDTFDPREASQACAAGAELVLSVNSTNREQALEWNAEVVVVPDIPSDEKFFSKRSIFCFITVWLYAWIPSLNPSVAGSLQA